MRGVAPDSRVLNNADDREDFYTEKRSESFTIMENLANMLACAIFSRPRSRSRPIARVPFTALLIICHYFHSTRYRGPETAGRGRPRTGNREPVPPPGHRGGNPALMPHRAAGVPAARVTAVPAAPPAGRAARLTRWIRTIRWIRTPGGLHIHRVMRIHRAISRPGPPPLTRTHAYRQ
jgi:hypothetical protein